LAGKYFNTVLYTGNGATSSAGTTARTITGAGFQPDLIWWKSRDNTGTWDNHSLTDAVRGNNLSLSTNATDSETNVATGFGNGGIGGPASDGFTIVSGTTGSTANVNTNNEASVTWLWNAGGSNATNTSGTITSTVRASTTSGFSIVTYTGTGTAGSVGHGLGVVPGMIIAKRRSSAQNWGVAHSSLTGTQTLYLDLTQGVATGVWNGTPTSTVFNITTDGVVNTNGSTYVAYCFAPVAGYSAFGSYTGNGSTDGPFVYLGFRPEFIMTKSTSNLREWYMYDAARNTYNVSTNFLRANTSAAEGSFTSYDMVSNGFKLRSSDTAFNGSGETYIYMAFAEFPFKFSLAR
jgi:hypothetical protein